MITRNEFQITNFTGSFYLDHLVYEAKINDNHYEM